MLFSIFLVVLSLDPKIVIFLKCHIYYCIFYILFVFLLSIAYSYFIFHVCFLSRSILGPTGVGATCTFWRSGSGDAVRSNDPLDRSTIIDLTMVRWWRTRGPRDRILCGIWWSPIAFLGGPTASSALMRTISIRDREAHALDRHSGPPDRLPK